MIAEPFPGAFGLYCGVASVVIVIVALAAFFIWSSRSSRDTDRRIAAATPATATVTNVGHSYASRNDGNVEVELTLQVKPLHGDPYEATATWFVEPASIPKIQAGNTVQIKIDAQDRTRIYSGESWASGY